jgi:hypothetical protein
VQVQIINENFDGVVSPAIPSDVVVDNAAVATTAAHAYSGTNGLTSTPAGAYYGCFSKVQDGAGGNVRVLGKVYWGGINNSGVSIGGVLARCSTQNMGTLSGYFFNVWNFSGGAFPNLHKRSGGVNAALTNLIGPGTGSGVTAAFFGANWVPGWYQLELDVTTNAAGTAVTLRGYIQRLSDGKFWQPLSNINNTACIGWVQTKVPCFVAVDSASPFTAAGYVGLGTYNDVGIANQAYLDDLYSITLDATGSVTPDQPTWRVANVTRPFSLISPAPGGVQFSQAMAATPQIESWSKLASGGAAAAFSGNAYNLTLAAGASSVLCVTNKTPVAPFAAAVIKVSNCPNPGSGAKSRVYCGLASDALNYVLAYYDARAGQLGVEVGHAGVITNLATYNVTLPTSFSLALTLTQSGLGVWTNTTGNAPTGWVEGLTNGSVANGGWTLQNVGHLTMPSAAVANTPDFSNAGVLQAYSFTFGAAGDAANMITVTEFDAGYFGTAGCNDYWAVRDLATGQPILISGEPVFTVDISGISDLGTLDFVDFSTNHTAVWSLNQTTYQFTERAKIYWSAARGLVGDSNLMLRRDATNARWLQIHAVTGNLSFTASGIQQAASYSTANLTSGINLVPEGTNINFGDGSTHFDAGMFPTNATGGLMEIVILTATSLTEWNQTAASGWVLSSDLSTATLQWQDGAFSGREGPREMELGGVWYMPLSDNFGGASHAYSIDGQTIVDMPGSWANVYAITANAAVDGGTRLLRVGFDNVNQIAAARGAAQPPLLSNGASYVFEAIVGSIPAAIPAASDVRSGVAVSSGNGEGTLAVPAPAAVLSPTIYDNGTVGTAVSQANVLAALAAASIDVSSESLSVD